MRRILDIVLAGCLLLLSAPILLVSGVLIKVFSPGPVLFKQTRAGLGGRRFAMLKLRTMQVDAERWLGRWLAEHPEEREEWIRYRRLTNDPRVIPWIGRALRRYSVDELPQLWNVVRGEMTMVGPRPVEIEVLDHFPAKYRQRRARVRPGLTGLWQVSGRSELDLRRMLALDLLYLRKRSAVLDLSILVRTPLAALRARGAY